MELVTNDISFRLIKSADIGYITLLYITSAYYSAFYTDKMFRRMFKGDIDKKSCDQLMYEIVVQVCFSAVVSYFGRNIIMLIPSPLDGINGFDHYRVKELNSGAVFLMFLIMLQKDLQKKIAALRRKL